MASLRIEPHTRDKGGGFSQERPPAHEKSGSDGVEVLVSRIPNLLPTEKRNTEKSKYAPHIFENIDRITLQRVDCDSSHRIRYQGYIPHVSLGTSTHI